jgi:hypothetical protein
MDVNLNTSQVIKKSIRLSDSGVSNIPLETPIHTAAAYVIGRAVLAFLTSSLLKKENPLLSQKCNFSFFKILVNRLQNCLVRVSMQC